MVKGTGARTIRRFLKTLVANGWKLPDPKRSFGIFGLVDDDMIENMIEIMVDYVSRSIDYVSSQSMLSSSFQCGVFVYRCSCNMLVLNAPAVGNALLVWLMKHSFVMFYLCPASPKWTHFISTTLGVTLESLESTASHLPKYKAQLPKSIPKSCPPCKLS